MRDIVPAISTAAHKYRFRHNDLEMTLPEWARHLDIPYITLYKRYRRGWSIDRMLGTTLNPKTKNK